MVTYPTVTATNVAFIKKQPLTAVFVGATNGIGEFTVRELCKTHGHDGPGLRIIIVGRNEKAAHQIMTECKSLCSAVEFHFVQGGDISLLHSVDKACDGIKDLLESKNFPSIDMLVMTQGKVEFGPRIGEIMDTSFHLVHQYTDDSKTRKIVLINRCPCSTTRACASSTTCFQICSALLHPPAPELSRSMQGAWRPWEPCTPRTSL